MASLAKLRLMAMAAREPQRSALKREFARRWFRVYNGQCNWIEGKHEFTGLARRLGYLAPDSVILEPQAGLTGNVEMIERLDTDHDQRICKPWFDSFGRGLHVAASPEAALRFVETQPRPYLVQSFMPPVLGEWRYILHRTAADLRSRQKPSVRMAAQKLGPTVVGNGRHTVKQLIAANRSWSVADRRKLMMAATTDIPQPGQEVQLVNSGNISRKLHRFVFPDATTLQRLDAHMIDFLDALEAFIDGRFGTICVDVGLTAQGFVFYELQIPFGNPYGRSSGTGSQHAAARSQLVKSMYLSGLVV
jgi:hypothetical protein